MTPGGVILHVESVLQRDGAGTRARVRVDGGGEYREAWFQHRTVRAGESAVCILVENGAGSDEPDVSFVGNVQTSSVRYLLPRGTFKRAQRWFDKHPNVR
jgi:hypothetical protein